MIGLVRGTASARPPSNHRSHISNQQSPPRSRACALLQPGSDFTTAGAEARLRARFPGYSVARGGDRITVAKPDWAIELWLNADPSVLTESIGLAEKIAGLADGTDIESC